MRRRLTLAAVSLAVFLVAAVAWADAPYTYFGSVGPREWQTEPSPAGFVAGGFWLATGHRYRFRIIATNEDARFRMMLQQPAGFLGFGAETVQEERGDNDFVLHYRVPVPANGDSRRLFGLRIRNTSDVETDYEIRVRRDD